MMPIVNPVEREALLTSFSEETRLTTGRAWPLEIHAFAGSDHSRALAEVGRLREATFRFVGSGTGRALDVDDFDTAADGYRQLVVFHRVRQEIVAGCRVRLGRTASLNPFASESLFEFSETFRQQYADGLLDIGRMFVIPRLQVAGGEREGTFVLDNLFHGLAAIAQREKRLTHFFGRLVLPKVLPARLRDLCMYFLAKHFAGDHQLVRPRVPEVFHSSTHELARVLVGANWRDDLRFLQNEARRLGSRVPPLLRAYVSLSPTLRTFGVTRDPELSAIEEVAILVKVSEIRRQTRRRYGIEEFEQERL